MIITNSNKVFVRPSLQIKLIICTVVKFTVKFYYSRSHRFELNNFVMNTIEVCV